MTEDRAEIKLLEDREYRIGVLAAWKAIAWLSFPAVFIIMAWLGVGEQISDWAERGFLDGELWEGFVLAPLHWAAIAALVALGVYSTVVKWIWDTWDRRVKYVRALERDTPADQPAR